MVALVVIDTSRIPGIAATARTRATTPFLAKGSPPVIRTFDMPSPEAIRTTRANSSMLSISSWVLGLTPSAGMQYTHLKLHLSVTETRM
jgi:hypothetical protein